MHSGPLFSSGDPRLILFADGHFDLMAEGAKGGVELVCFGRMVETEQAIHLLTMPPPSSRKFGARDPDFLEKTVEVSRHPTGAWL